MAEPRLTRAEALCWVAHLLHVEGSALTYAWPRTDEQLRAGGELDDAGNAFADAAHAIDPSDDELWRRALDKWDDGYQEARPAPKPAPAPSKLP